MKKEVIDVSSKSQFIAQTFTWENTKEGSDFWVKVYGNLCKSKTNVLDSIP